MLICDDSQSDIVKFEGHIIGTDERDSSTLKEALEQWVSNEPTVSVQGKQVQVVNPANKEENDSSNIGSIAIGVSIAGIVIIFTLVSVIVSCTFILKHKQSR